MGRGESGSDAAGSGQTTKTIAVFGASEFERWIVRASPHPTLDPGFSPNRRARAPPLHPVVVSISPRRNRPIGPSPEDATARAAVTHPRIHTGAMARSRTHRMPTSLYGIELFREGLDA